MFFDFVVTLIINFFHNYFNCSYDKVVTTQKTSKPLPSISFEACKTGVLEDLLRQLFAEYGRPVTISARSYQAWLRDPLEELGGQAWEERALLVKHLALRSPSPETVEEALFDNAKAKSGAFSMKTQK